MQSLSTFWCQFSQKWILKFVSVHSVSRVQLFATPWTVAHQASLSFTISQSLLKLMFIESVMPSNHLILCQPLLLLPSIFPSIRVFSSESVLRIRWPKYWSFNFSLSPSNEYSGLISFSEVKYRLKFGVSVVKANVGRSHKLQRRASVKIQR